MWFKFAHTIRHRMVLLAAVAVGCTVLLSLAGASDQPVETAHKVHVAFGFHVNLYHSFRNDTNDENGFGKDIRIIRHIIRTLDHYNAKGIPVKGVWDFDNLFSLQEILPRYAPDIIDDIRRRVHNNGDEVILMSYNNGLVSAMDREELDAAVRWSITNPWQSGVLDLFGKYTPIVRPQEMMTTAGNFSVYKSHGIQALSLYYSATPFDTFRVFSRQLSRAEAHNPILFRHPQTAEEMIIIPTYHFGDLLEHVSLKHWVSELRALQRSGRLNQDALIFINYDADSELWSGVDLPWIMNWLPNTGGIGALVDEVKQMRQVEFSTVGEYLKDHPPVGTVSFGQDTADGSFNGYNSWAEKADTSRYWTAIERSRRARDAARKALTVYTDSLEPAALHDMLAAADLKRLRALSTTNFGMATPFLAPQRELAMAELVEALNDSTAQIEASLADGLRRYIEKVQRPPMKAGRLSLLDSVLVLGVDRGPDAATSRFIRIPVPRDYSGATALSLISLGGERHPVIDLGIQSHRGATPMLSLYIPDERGLKDGIYGVYTGVRSDGMPPAEMKDGPADRQDLSNGRLSIRFAEGTVTGIYLDGALKAGPGSLLPNFTWSGEIFHARPDIVEARQPSDGQLASVRLAGPIPGPVGPTRHTGWMDYTFSLFPDRPYLMLQGRIRYPATEKGGLFKASSPGLTRRADMQWEEVAPAEIRFVPTGTTGDPLRILKKNYLGFATQYALDYFHHDASNLNLDNVNNHITSAYVGLVAGESGMAIAMDNSTQSNFAFAPVRMRYHVDNAAFSASINPFGTYHGNQYSPRSWGNGNGFDATLLAGEQFASAAPTYNGVEQGFSMMFAFFGNRGLPPAIEKDLVEYANPPVVISAAKVANNPLPDRPLEAPQAFMAAYEDGAVRFGWDNGHSLDHRYRIYCGTASGRYDAVYPAVGNSLMVTELTGGQPFKRGVTYFATIEKILHDGSVSERAEEIKFVPRPAKAARLDVPLRFELKVLWANVHALLTRPSL